MIIIHRLKDFSFEIFSDLKKYSENIEHHEDLIKENLIDFYTFGAFRPNVTIEDGIVTIEIDTDTIDKYNNEFTKATRFAEQKRFREAKDILKTLINKNPTISEFHRTYGQILEVEGNYEEAKDYIVDALKWDPRNNYALIMMGNIYARHHKDIDTATKYYNEVLRNNPNDHIALNNIGGNLANLKKYDDAERYFQLAYEINKDYPNTSYGLALINQMKGKYKNAFDFAIESLKKARVDDEIYKHSYALAVEASKEYSKIDDNKEIYYWDYNKVKQKTNGNFKFSNKNENNLDRKFFPLPHQPSLSKDFYKDTLDDYLNFVKRNC